MHGEASTALRLICDAIFHGHLACKSEQFKRRVLAIVWNTICKHSYQDMVKLVGSLSEKVCKAIVSESVDSRRHGLMLMTMDSLELDLFELHHHTYNLGFSSACLNNMCTGVSELDEEVILKVAFWMEGRTTNE